MDLPIKQHSAESSKLLVKVVIGMLLMLQLMGGFIIKSFYDRFVALEEAHDKNDDAIEAIKAQMKILETRSVDMQDLGKITELLILKNKGDQ